MPTQSLWLPRRQFLRATAASTIAASFASSSGLRAAPPDQRPSHATLKAGDLTAVAGDNSAEGEHRAGDNGVWDLRHAAGSRNVFVPAVAGLNLEHIVTGEHLDDTKKFFEPRNAPMTAAATRGQVSLSRTNN